VASSALILRSFFGGEEGITTNRTKLLRIFDWSFGPQIQVYYLIAFWCLVCVIAMYALTRTRFGRMCNAVREISSAPSSSLQSAARPLLRILASPASSPASPGGSPRSTSKS